MDDRTTPVTSIRFLNINSLLSAIFTHARRSGTLRGPNPTDGVEIPAGKRTGKTHKYTLEEVEKITECVDGVARCAVVVAAWTGLSLAELRGLKWEDIDFKNESLNVVRTVWHNEIIDTKTEHRAAAVPLLPNVIAELKRHHEENPRTTWVFEGPRDFPLDLATLGSAVSQFPTRTPSLRTPFTRRMPAVRSGLRSPQSDASYASRRIAANLRLIVDGAYGCCSSAIRYRATTVLLKASRGSEQYQSMNSRIA
jgi:integrase